MIAIALLLVFVPGAARRHPSATVAAGPPAAPAPTGQQFGVNVNRLFNDRIYAPAQIEAQLQALQHTGATLARSDAQWEAAEPNPPVAGVHRYDWSFTDSIAGSLAAHGLRWLPIIDYSAPWTQSVAGQDHSPPAFPSDYAAFAAALAARYGSGGTFWREHPELAPQPVQTYEIWNEPDNAEFWVPAPNAGTYADLYLRTRDAIKAIDPAARVIVGGLTAPATFLPALVDARPDLRGHLDGVAIHPYRPTPDAVLTAIRADRMLLDALGLASVPLYVTEFGWTTKPPGALSWLPERLRPAYLATTLARLGHTDCGLAAALVYTWVTPEHDPANREDWFGIHPPGGGTSPDSDAFAAGLQGAVSPAPTVSLCG